MQKACISKHAKQTAVIEIYTLKRYDM